MAQAVQILKSETDPKSIITAEIVVEINDPENVTNKKLKCRINTTRVNSVGHSKAIAAAVDVPYKSWDKVHFLRDTKQHYR